MYSTTRIQVPYTGITIKLPEVSTIAPQPRYGELLMVLAGLALVIMMCVVLRFTGILL